MLCCCRCWVRQAGLRHKVDDTVMLYPGYMPVPNKDPRVLHYGLTMEVSGYKFNKADWRSEDVANTCGAHFPDPPDPTTLPSTLSGEERRRDLISIECVAVLNRAVREYHRDVMHCPSEGDVDVGESGFRLASPREEFEEQDRLFVIHKGEGVEGSEGAVLGEDEIVLNGGEMGLFVAVQGEGVDVSEAAKRSIEKGKREIEMVAHLTKKTEEVAWERRMMRSEFLRTHPALVSFLPHRLRLSYMVAWILMLVAFFSLLSRRRTRTSRGGGGGEGRGKSRLFIRNFRSSYLPWLSVGIPTIPLTKESKDTTE